ncbi:VCAN [Mytilus coruscus]|uniref:VCAN n=1 Tax=Mytilus coruscus TaxID=42192 RepID=A0A6J8EDV2_MYTCO|nr:VCAN [Mytilus coruscus]
MCSLPENFIRVVAAKANRKGSFREVAINENLKERDISLLFSLHICSMRKYVTDDGHTWFDLGCSLPETNKCGSSVSKIFGKRENEMFDSNSTNKDLNFGQLSVKSRSLTGERDICNQCCHSDICNAGSLCGTTAFQHTRRLCFACSFELDPTSCNDITLCSEECFVQKHTVGLGGTSVAWTSGCRQKALCHQIHSVHGPQCTISCCDWDLCNRECGADCYPNPCRNGGQCSNGFTGFHCSCSSQWTGTTCTVAHVVQPPTSGGKCRPGWEYLNTGGSYHCYYFSSNILSWDRAESWCRSQGARLAVIKSSTESRMLASQAERSHTSHGWWVGATDKKREGHWEWTSGESVTHYTNNWHHGEPSGKYHDEDCMELRQKFGWQWNDETCSTQHLFICKH